MLRAYGPGCDGSIVEAQAEHIPDGATWIDLEEPTDEEEALVERCIGVNVPTREEMAEIEPSSRLYEHNGALYMTISALYGVSRTDSPSTTPISFVLTGNRLVTRPLRDAQAGPPLRASMSRREPELARDAATVLVAPARRDHRPAGRRARGRRRRDRAASPSHIFSQQLDDARRIPAARLTALLTRDRPRADAARQDPLFGGQHQPDADFLAGSNRLHEQGDRPTSATISRASTTDVTSLSDHATSCRTI